jgi:hypothetical protein
LGALNLPLSGLFDIFKTPVNGHDKYKHS